MQTIRVRGVELGSGPPKVIVPLTGATAADLDAQAAAVVGAVPDLVEWRLDLLADHDPASAVEVGRRLVARLGGLPLLVTFRTAAEGGGADLTPRAYADLYRAVVGAGLADLVDVEVMLPEATVREVVALAHGAGVAVVASNHDVAATPEVAELLRRLALMRDLGADVLKVAVMPRDGGDVLRLLEATWQARELGRPLVTVAMGQVGVVSRLAGGVFGSAATFGMVDHASAPGQVDVAALRAALALLHGTGGPRVVLCGPMGSGKSAVGSALARRWRVAVRDTDADVERRSGRSVAAIFAEDGEERFRALEHEAVLAALGEHTGVLALGGGAVLHEGTRLALERYVAGGGAVVFLDVSADVAARRIGRGASRPLLAGDPRQRWVEIMDARRGAYEAVSTVRVLTDGLTPAAVASEVERRLRTEVP